MCQVVSHRITMVRVIIPHMRALYPPPLCQVVSHRITMVRVMG